MLTDYALVVLEATCSGPGKFAASDRLLVSGCTAGVRTPPPHPSPQPDAVTTETCKNRPTRSEAFTVGGCGIWVFALRTHHHSLALVELFVLW
jgi:hypothetical protein